MLPHQDGCPIFIRRLQIAPPRSGFVQPDHWTERGRLASVYNSNATDRPRQSVPSLGDSCLDMNRLVSRVSYCFSAIAIPCVAWGLTFTFMGRFRLPEASGTSLLWKIQCVAALLTVAICVGLRGRSSLVIALSFFHLGLSLILIVGALLLQLWMLQPMDQ